VNAYLEYIRHVDAVMHSRSYCITIGTINILYFVFVIGPIRSDLIWCFWTCAC